MTNLNKVSKINLLPTSTTVYTSSNGRIFFCEPKQVKNQGDWVLDCGVALDNKMRPRPWPKDQGFISDEEMQLLFFFSLYANTPC